MNNTELKPCPFCGGEARFVKYYETTDGKYDRSAMVLCKCSIVMELTYEELMQAQKDFDYEGGYYSSNKRFWEGMHQRLIDKWNRRV